MHVFLSGVSYNEFSGNSDTDIAIFENIKDNYGFHLTRSRAIIRLLLLALLYRIIWLLLLKLREIATEKKRLRRAMGAAKRRAKRLVSAGLRWRKSRQGYAMAGDNRDASVAGVGLVGIDADDYTAMNSTHGGRVPVFSPKAKGSPFGGAERVPSTNSSDSDRVSFYTGNFSSTIVNRNSLSTTPEPRRKTSIIKEDDLKV